MNLRSPASIAADERRHGCLRPAARVLPSLRNEKRPDGLTAVDRALGRAHELALDLLAKLWIHRFRPAQCRVGRNSVAFGGFIDEGVLSRQVMRHPARLD